MLARSALLAILAAGCSAAPRPPGLDAAAPLVMLQYETSDAALRAMTADGYELVGFDRVDEGADATSRRAQTLGAARIALVSIAGSPSKASDKRGYMTIREGQGLAAPIVMKSRMLVTVEDRSAAGSEASSLAVLYFAQR